MRAALFQLGEGHRLVVDLRRVTFMDSSGLSALLAGAQHAGGALWVELVTRAGPVDRLLRVAGFDRLFRLHTTLESALMEAAAGGHEGAEAAAPGDC